MIQRLRLHTASTPELALAASALDSVVFERDTLTVSRLYMEQSGGRRTPVLFRVYNVNQYEMRELQIDRGPGRDKFRAQIGPDQTRLFQLSLFPSGGEWLVTILDRKGDIVFEEPVYIP